ncbi:MAG: hypothetical protein HGN29_13405 [Asgard group archaeon]|nr:hypothetical protein [Asgard group archaeon]
MDKCNICGYMTNSHIIHTQEGKCYCTKHYLAHILHDDIEKNATKKIIK